MSDGNYSLLLKKLDEFVRKYYTNQIIRGIILFSSLALFFFLSIVLLEYIGQFDSTIRTVLFYSLALSLLLTFAIFILRPALKILAISKRLSHEQAAQIIGKHFSAINDKLFNILQLNQQSSELSSDLITASINQKIAQLKPIPFGTAINFKENKRYLKYFIVPFLIISGLAAFEPKIIVDSTNRIVAHSDDFEPTAPYDIVIEKKLSTYRNEDFSLSIKLVGDEIPKKLSVVFSKQRFSMTKKNKNNFTYTFTNLQSDQEFMLFDGEFESKRYTLKVLPKPVLVDFSVELNYPSYLKKPSANLKNTGDLIVPEGTHIKWIFNTADTEELSFLQNDSAYNLVKSGDDEFLYSDRFFKSTSYGLSTSNQFLKNEDTVFYSLEVIPDLYPSIELETKDDSLNTKMKYFRGFVKDDHGFSQLQFHSKFIGANDSIGDPISTSIPINKSLYQTDFFHAWNTNQFALKSGDRIEYYFEIWDNDGINGNKSSRSQTYIFKAPTQEELAKKDKENGELVKNELKESLKLTKEIRKDLEDLNEKLLNKKQLGFQEKKQLESLLNKQKRVKESLDKLKQQNQKNNRLQEEFSPEKEELLAKQRQLEELLDKVFSEEMKAMMEEVEKMMEKLQKDELQKSLEKIELSNEELEKELDRNLELFKQLELEKELDAAKEKLDALKEEQKALKEESLDKKEETEELKEKQDELTEEFKKLDEQLDSIQKKNQELEEPNKLEDTQSLEEEIKKEMQESAEELDKKNRKNAAKQQQESEEKMEELSEKLEEMQMQMESGVSVENLENLRAILENLVQLSFDQEDVMQSLKNTNRNDPKYVSLSQVQKKLKDDSKIIEDSLFALSKRVIQLESTINKEITAVNFNMEKAIKDLEERKTAVANSRQQLSMTSINNLALLLDEAVQSMQMQMQAKKGKGKCDKPGGKKPSSGGMKKMQQQLNKQMQSLKEAMEKGKKPGGKKGEAPGKDGKKGKGGMSKELAQMAAKQAALREAIEQMQQEQQKQGESNGKGGGNLKKIGELMEQTETDLVNKQITNQTLLRQQEILSRLLQSEKAEKEREKDEKREATEFKEEISQNQKSIFEYNTQKEKEIELLKTLPPTFNNFYKAKVTEYFYQLDK